MMMIFKEKRSEEERKTGSPPSRHFSAFSPLFPYRHTYIPTDDDPSSKLPPLVVVPHGGPHAVTPTTFSHAYAFLCVSFGFAILHINFRGSTGFGGNAFKRIVRRSLTS